MEENKVKSNSSSKDNTSEISQENKNYIWFGVYNEMLLNENISKVLEKCNDKSLPKESASIHLNKFIISFNKNNIFILFKENSSIFIKLYLITKNQLIDILKNEYKCNEKIENDFENIFKLQKINDEIFLDQYQNENNFYNTIKNIGIFNQINIYSITTKNKNIDLQAPDKEYLNKIYIGLKESFYLYSDYLIMYYLSIIHEIKTTYSLQKLTEIFFGNKELKSKNENKIVIKEIENQKQLWYFLPKNEEKIDNKNEDINEYNYILNMDTLPEFDETTGEFFWNNNDSNWEKVNQKINSNIEIKNKVVNIDNGSIIKLIGDIIEKDKGENKNNKDISENQQNTLKKNTLKYIEELSNILDTK